MRPAVLLDYLFFSRPVLLVPVWTFFLLGYGGALDLWESDPRLWVGLVAITAAFGAAFVLNQYFDVPSDEKNRKCLFLSSGRISTAGALRYYAVLNLIALGCLFQAPWLTLPLLLVLILGALYSAPPWLWKDRPFLALAANAIGHGPLVFIAGRLAAGADWLAAISASWPYLCGAAAVYLLTTIPDLDGDAAAGKRTLAVTLGPERTARWALGWCLGALLLAVYHIDVLFVLGVLPSLPAFVRAGRGDLTRVRSAIRFSVLGLSLAAAWLHLWYLLVLAAGFAATRAYYRRAWNCRYP